MSLASSSVYHAKFMTGSHALIALYLITLEMLSSQRFSNLVYISHGVYDSAISAH